MIVKFKEITEKLKLVHDLELFNAWYGTDGIRFIRQGAAFTCRFFFVLNAKSIVKHTILLNNKHSDNPY